MFLTVDMLELHYSWGYKRICFYIFLQNCIKTILFLREEEKKSVGTWFSIVMSFKVVNTAEFALVLTFLLWRIIINDKLEKLFYENRVINKAIYLLSHVDLQLISTV